MKVERIGRLLVIPFLLLCAYLVWREFISEALERKLYPLHYTDAVEASAGEFGLPPELVYAVILTESSFDPDVVSTAGAKGLMQLTDDTNEWVAWRLGEESEPSRIFEPGLNIRRGCYLLSYLYERFGGWNEALAAYNAGVGRVDGWLDDLLYSSDQKTLIIDKLPIEETRSYIAKVLKSAEKYKKLYFEENSEEI
ncbi:MAG TPA: lytic transglycosylase domain-containing protein [Firmicutes bacterium]|nr:lytic transglycosylase domain-containing protein [Bacillota bacterium]